MSEEKDESEAISVEDVKFVSKAPRLFRNSLVHKTLELVFPSNKPKSISNRSFRENVWWFLVMFVGFCMAFSIVDKAWQRFQRNPTFTSVVLNEDGMRVTYPTVDVCPKISIDFEKIKQILGREFLEESSQIIQNFQHLSTATLKELLNALKTDDLRILAHKVSLQCIDLVTNCEFKGQPIDCCTKFLPFLTEHGLCYSFNTKVYGTSISELKNPQMMSMIEFEDHRLRFDLMKPSNLFVHSRDEFLNHQTNKIATIEKNVTAKILFSLQQTHTDTTAHGLRLNQRRCFFADEKRSKFYANQRYSSAACHRDCRIERVQENCGCLSPFYRPNNVDNLTYCGVADLTCLRSENLMAQDQCDECHLPCDFVAVSIEKVSFLARNVSSVDINLHQWPHIAFHREIRFGFVDFLVAFGSIFALFLGFSLLSLVEISLSILKSLFTGRKQK